MPLPKEPYEPILKQFSLSYTAQETISLNTSSPSESKCYQMSPFGHKVLGQSEPLLPQYILDDGSNANGSLYLGLDNLSKGQSISLLIKMTEGYVDTANISNGELVEWCYLAEDV